MEKNIHSWGSISGYTWGTPSMIASSMRLSAPIGLVVQLNRDTVRIPIITVSCVYASPSCVTVR